MIPRVYRASTLAARCIHSGSPALTRNYKYAERLQRIAKEKGVDLDKLKSQAREEARRKQKEEAASLFASFKNPDPGHTHPKFPPTLDGTRTFGARKDGSPVKASVADAAVVVNSSTSPLQPLSSILNLSKLLATPHTSPQISALWTAYHASRAKGTGRGYICASLPLESYDAMMHVGKKYPVFVIPVPRMSASDRSAGGSSGAAHEFFFLQWDFHPSPPVPYLGAPFEPTTSSGSGPVPELSTVLFTPLQEYKHRGSFATPYLVLTFYTDLSRSHGIVLLRGEITPSSNSADVRPGKEIPARFLLNQVDAQLLTMGLQKFYLWARGEKEDDHDPTAEALLKQFHEDPEKFNWQDLVKSSGVIA